MNNNNPINETSTRYSYHRFGGEDGTNRNEYTDPKYFDWNIPDHEEYVHLSSDQNIFTGEPISNIDSEYLNSYRNQIEQLRVKTESTNAALQAALVPSIVKGENVYTPILYAIDDTLYMVNTGLPEYVYRVNHIKFKTDYHRRLSLHKTIHLYTQKGQSLKDIATNLLKYDTEYSGLTVNSVCARMLDSKYNYALKNIPYNRILDTGIEIDTGLEPKVYTLYQMGYIYPFMIFVNNKAISWCDMKILSDALDTYLIIDASAAANLYKTDPAKTVLKYMNIPFGIDYIPKERHTPKYDDVTLGRFPIPVFFFDPKQGYIRNNSDYTMLIHSGATNKEYLLKTFDRVFINDDRIKYIEMKLDDEAAVWNTEVSGERKIGENTSGYAYGTSGAGILYFKEFRSIFNELMKLKKFNFLCFENVEDGNPNGESLSNRYTTELREDFDVSVSIFNIAKIRFSNLLGGKRLFKIFYNTGVLYDQDNFLRFGNKDRLYTEYLKYVKRRESSIHTFIKEVYRLYIQDIGAYVPVQYDKSKYNPEINGAYYYNIDNDYFQCAHIIDDDQTHFDEEGNIKEYQGLKIVYEGPIIQKDYNEFYDSGRIIPNGFKEGRVVIYDPNNTGNVQVGKLGMHLERVHFDNMEEGPTPVDEFIYYDNLICADILREIAYQIFGDDTIEVRQVIDKLIMNSYKPNYLYEGQQHIQDLERDEWLLRKNVHEMFVSDENNNSMDALKHMWKLDIPFDFHYNDHNIDEEPQGDKNTYGEYKNNHRKYGQNLDNAINYIISYDADKLESTIKRNVISKSYIWQDMLDKGWYTYQSIPGLGNRYVLSIPRMKSDYYSETYAIIYVNGKLIDNYYTMDVTTDPDRIRFVMINSVDYVSSSEVEILYFLNCNNRITENIPCNLISVPSYKSGLGSSSFRMEYAIPTNTQQYKPEELLIFNKKLCTTDNFYDRKSDDVEYINYLIYYDLYSFVTTMRDARQVPTYGHSPLLQGKLDVDYKLNGSYRTSKFDLEEYFIFASDSYYNGRSDKEYLATEIPTVENTTTDNTVHYKSRYKEIDKLKDTNFDLASNRQFRYIRHICITGRTSTDDPIVVELNKNFYHCPFDDHFIVMKNGYTINRQGYKVMLPSKDTPDYKPQILINVDIEPNDVIHIFYVPNRMVDITDKFWFIDRSGNIQMVNTEGEVTEHGICTKNTLQYSSRYSTMIIMNGCKVPLTHILDVTDTKMRLYNNYYGSTLRLEIYSFVDDDENKYVYAFDGLTHEATTDFKSGKFLVSDIYEQPNATKASLLSDMHQTLYQPGINVLDGDGSIGSISYYNSHTNIRDNVYGDRSDLVNFIAHETLTESNMEWIRDILGEDI